MATSRVLQPYVRRKEPGPIKRFLWGVSLVFLGAFYGLMCSVLPAQLLAIPLVPILILAALCLWMLPDIGAIGEASTRRMMSMMLLFMALYGVWPYYVAFDLPGLPWITPTRIAVAIMAVTFIFGISSSAHFRAQIWEVMGQDIWIRRLFWAFWALTTLSLVFSGQPAFSINKYFNNQVFWTMMFAAACYLSRFPGFVEKMVKLLIITMCVAMFVGLYEARVQRVFWLPYLPSFLRADPEVLERVAAAQNRAGTDVYRVRGTFSVSLYFAQYLAMVFPFVLHYFVKAKDGLKRMALGLLMMGMIVVMYVTNARSAMVGLVIAIVVYPFFVVYRKRRRDPGALGANTGFFAYPAGVGVVVLIILFWRRARVAVLGGGQHQASSDARGAQWDMGMPKVYTHPFGHGVGRSGDVLGYTNPAGDVTIDTHYLSVLLDYGLLALPIYIAMFALPMWIAFKHYNVTTTREGELVAPLALAILNFIIIQSVLSSELQVPMALIFLGCILGLMWQHKQQEAPPPARQPGRDLVPARA